MVILASPKTLGHSRREVGRDDHRGALVEPADQVKEQLAAGLSEGQVAELVEHDEVEAGEMIGDAALAAGAGLGVELVDEVYDVEEAATGAAANAGACDGDGDLILYRERKLFLASCGDLDAVRSHGGSDVFGHCEALRDDRLGFGDGEFATIPIAQEIGSAGAHR